MVTDARVAGVNPAEKRMCKFCGRDGVERTMEFYPGGVYGACRNVEACEKRRKAGDRKSDLAEAIAERERAMRIRVAGVEYASQMGLDPNIDSYHLDEKTRKKAAGLNPNVLWDAWLAHRIGLLMPMGSRKTHHCAPEPCFRDIVRCYRTILKGYVPLGRPKRHVDNDDYHPMVDGD